MENVVPEKTKHGAMFGRDTLYLDEISAPDERHLVLNGIIHTHAGQDRNYEIKFNGTVYVSITESDRVTGYGDSGSFCVIENSETIKKLKHINFDAMFADKHRHFFFATYDSVFQVVAIDYQLKFFPLRTS